jgi:hypothetical protein
MGFLWGPIFFIFNESLQPQTGVVRFQLGVAVHGGSMGRLDSIKAFFKEAYIVVRQVNRDKATGMLEFELKEMENIFLLLIIGGFVGMPSPPAPVALELLPYLEKEIAIMLSRSDLSNDPLGALMGMLEID